MITALLLILAALGVGLLIHWATKDGPPVGDNWLEKAEDVEKRVASNLNSSAASFRADLSARDADPNKPKA